MSSYYQKIKAEGGERYEQLKTKQREYYRRRRLEDPTYGRRRAWDRERYLREKLFERDKYEHRANRRKMRKEAREWNRFEQLSKSDEQLWSVLDEQTLAQLAGYLSGDGWPADT